MCMYNTMYTVTSTTEKITLAKEWLKSLPINDMQPVMCGSDTLDQSHIEEIEKALSSLAKTNVS